MINTNARHITPACQNLLLLLSLLIRYVRMYNTAWQSVIYETGVSYSLLLQIARSLKLCFAHCAHTMHANNSRSQYKCAHILLYMSYIICIRFTSNDELNWAFIMAIQSTVKF